MQAYIDVASFIVLVFLSDLRHGNTPVVALRSTLEGIAQVIPGVTLIVGGA